MWDLETEVTQLEIEIGDTGVNCASFGPNGEYLVSGSEDGIVRLWESKSGRLLSKLQSHKGGVSAIAVDPKGKFIASGANDGWIQTWDLQRARRHWVSKWQKGYLTSIAFSPDGERLVSTRVVRTERAGFWAGTISLWDPDAGQLLIERTVPGEAATSVLFSPDGKRIISSLIPWDQENANNIVRILESE